MARIVLMQPVMQKNYLLHAVASSLLLVGCLGTAQVRGTATVSAPELVFISPGVQVIADYREPIFYTDSYYWRYQGNVWYRSSTYTGGWVRYSAVPVAILRIEQPSMYVHYRGAARVSGPVEHRGSPPPTPAMNREERKEEKAEQKEERKEQKAEQKEERKEQKEERKEQKEERKDDRKDNKKGRP